MLNAMQSFEDESHDNRLEGRTVARLFGSLGRDVSCLMVMVPTGTLGIDIALARAYHGRIADIFIFE